MREGTGKGAHEVKGKKGCRIAQKDQGIRKGKEREKGGADKGGAKKGGREGRKNEDHGRKTTKDFSQGETANTDLSFSPERKKVL